MRFNSVATNVYRHQLLIIILSKFARFPSQSSARASCKTGYGTYPHR